MFGHNKQHPCLLIFIYIVLNYRVTIRACNILIIILIISVKLLSNKLIQKLHVSKNYKLSEDCQKHRPKYVGATINE
jgi:hypothetical protein